jgi:hypothetical protein
MKRKYKMTEEHKRKIGEANRISLKGKHVSPKTEFKRGRISERKGKAFPQIREEKHYAWTGGSEATARRIALRLGRDLSRCQICGETDKRIDVHHIDGNFRNNNNFNLGIICSFCHFAIHDNGKETRFKSKEVEVLA